MARFLEILMRLRKFITKWKENSADPAENSVGTDHFLRFSIVFRGEAANGHHLPPDKITSIRLSLTFLLTVSLAKGSSIQETPNTAALKKSTVQYRETEI
ncbi:hypothetical protein CO660_01010 [Rhizobium sp. L9]|uniref:hypothetical protein n=1 Tax=Rhizobium sp. L9 TaxID=1340738 RepID=UPI000BEA8B5C|nr:hypothetical protein [Rhizobium sp. L9]PDT32027.1 hypothetical protein CO660_01010 [Rhizobium sp. L9]